jgi:hypothetical protein
MYGETAGFEGLGDSLTHVAWTNDADVLQFHGMTPVGVK